MNQRTDSPNSDLADRLDASPVDLGSDQACILVLIEGGFRASVVASGLDDALAEVRRRRAVREGGAAAQSRAAA